MRATDEITTVTARVYREGRWWMIEVPPEGVTQARHAGEVSQMAQELAALTLDIPVDAIRVDLTWDLGGLDIAAELAHLADERSEAKRLEIAAATRARALARSLSAQGIPLRDIGALLGVTMQRAHQLARS